MIVNGRDIVKPWRALRRAVREAHALGVQFRICGDQVQVDGIDRLPDKLREVLDPGLLWAYTGADEDDEEAITFLEELGAEAVLITDVCDAAAAVAELEEQKSPVIGIDIETAPKPEFAEPRPPIQINQDGSVRKPKAPDRKVPRPPAIDPHRAEIATLQLYAGGAKCFVFRAAAIEWVLASPWFNKQTFVAHNAAFEYGFLYHRGIHVNIGCTLQAGGLVIGVGFGGEKRALDSVATEVLGLTPPKALQTSDWAAPQLSPGQICYAASDAILAYHLWPKLRSELIKHRRSGAYLLQRSAVPAVAAMESRGLCFDTAEHASQIDEWSLKLAEARRSFRDITGESPPVNDNEIRYWLQRVAPEDVLQSWPRTAAGESLSVEGKHLKRLLALPGIPEIIEAKALQHRLSNFGPKLIDFISPATGRIHCAFNLAATKAGRFSASKPNLQQMPGDKAAPNFRRCFVAAPGYVFVGCDWNQVEMRAAAWLSRCPVMTAVYTANPVRDLHQETAAAIARVAPDQVTDAQRQAAKPVNFGSIYGIGAVTLSEDAFDNYGIVMAEAEAQRALDSFFATFWGFNDWRWQHWRECKATGRVIVPGSGRTVERAWEYGGTLRFTQCCNIPIQGICADAMLLAIRLVHERLQGLDAGLVVTIHDELLVEASERDAEQAHAILEDTMVEAFVRTFPGAPYHSVAQAAIGADWYAVKHPQKDTVTAPGTGNEVP
jgi:DNA polymerase-1